MSSSCPIPVTIGILEAKINLTISSELKGIRSSSEPPPLDKRIISLNESLFAISIELHTSSIQFSPCIKVGIKINFTKGYLIVITFLISSHAEEFSDVITHIVCGNKGISRFLPISNKPSCSNLCRNLSISMEISPNPCFLTDLTFNCKFPVGEYISISPLIKILSPSEKSSEPI